MSEIIYEGPFKGHIKNHVELKRAVGYKYDAEAAQLKRFDRFTLEKYPCATVLTKEIVLDWCSKKTYEAQANQCSRASVIRQFGRYLDSIGVKAYIIPRRITAGWYPCPITSRNVAVIIQKRYILFRYRKITISRHLMENR
jgi:integrase/recombinase XerD